MTTGVSDPIVRVGMDPEVIHRLRELDYARKVAEKAEEMDDALAALHPNSWAWTTKAQRRAFLGARRALAQAIHNYRMSRIVEDSGFDVHAKFTSEKP